MDPWVLSRGYLSRVISHEAWRLPPDLRCACRLRPCHTSLRWRIASCESVGDVNGEGGSHPPGSHPSGSHPSGSHPAGAVRRNPIGGVIQLSLHYLLTPRTSNLPSQVSVDYGMAQKRAIYDNTSATWTTISSFVVRNTNDSIITCIHLPLVAVGVRMRTCLVTRSLANCCAGRRRVSPGRLAIASVSPRRAGQPC